MALVCPPGFSMMLNSYFGKAQRGRVTYYIGLIVIWYLLHCWGQVIEVVTLPTPWLGFPGRAMQWAAWLINFIHAIMAYRKSYKME